jgi:hydroxymethylpyrimidine pyrophosphatase-like HAD family hydrolase
MKIVKSHKNITFFAQGFNETFTIFVLDSGIVFGINKDNKKAVVKNQKNAGKNKSKNSQKLAFQDVQAIRVVISQNGLQAHHEFAQTTITIAIGTSIFWSFDILRATVDKINAVVKLSAIGDIKKAKNQSIQKSCL